MKLLCEWFGHKVSGSTTPLGYPRYFYSKGGPIDGLNTIHHALFAECDRCGDKFLVGHIHTDKDDRIYTQKQTVQKPTNPSNPSEL